MTSNVWHRFCLIAERTRVLVKCQHYHVIHRLVRNTIQCWKQDQEYKTKTKTGLRPILS